MYVSCMYVLCRCFKRGLALNLSYQNELRVRNTPVDGENTSDYMKDHIFELRRKI